MIFITTQHYENEKHKEIINETKEENECFVCYELSIDNETSPIELFKQTDYIKMCLCNGWIHKKCLMNWYETSGNCPICRKLIRKKPSLVENLKQYTIFIVFPLFIIKNVYKLTRFLTLFVFFYYTIDFYLNIFNSKNTFDHSCIIYENSRVLYDLGITSTENTE
jgi:E3 ubiquitin-protein ligase DOA10